MDLFELMFSFNCVWGVLSQAGPFSFCSWNRSGSSFDFMAFIPDHVPIKRKPDNRATSYITLHSRIRDSEVYGAVYISTYTYIDSDFQ